MTVSSQIDKVGSGYVASVFIQDGQTIVQKFSTVDFNPEDAYRRLAQNIAWKLGEIYKVATPKPGVIEW